MNAHYRAQGVRAEGPTPVPLITPVRMLGLNPTTASRRGVFQSRKVDASLHHESGLEKSAFMRFEADPRVKSYCPQPFTLRYFEDGQAASSTPDILVETATGKVTVEVKPLSKLCLPDVARKIAATAHLLRQRGEKYIVLTEREIYSQPAHENSLLVARYRWWPLDPDAREKVLSYCQDFEQLPAKNLLSFMSFLGNDAPHVLLTMMAQDYFDFDISMSLDIALTLRLKQSAK